MTTLLTVLQTALICYIFLVSLSRAKGKLKLILVGVDFAYILVLLLLYLLIANILSLPFMVTSFVVLILTVVYIVGIGYIISKYYVPPVTKTKEKRASSRSREDNDPYNDDIDDPFDNVPSVRIDSSRVSRERQSHRSQTNDDGITDLFDRTKPNKSVIEHNLGSNFESRPKDKSYTNSFDLGLGMEPRKNDFSDLGSAFGKENKMESNDFKLKDNDKATLENKNASFKNDNISETDDLLSDFLFDFGGASNAADSKSEKPIMSFDTPNGPQLDFGFGSNAVTDTSDQADLSLDELIGDFSFLKGTLARTDNKFMTTDMDLEYVLLENINAQNIRVKVIDKKTIYINKFASEIALANAQRLLIESNITDAKKLLAQLCCSSTDSAISNEAYVCYKEIVLGKDSELEVDDLINAMIDKEEKLLEVVKKITEGQN